MKEIFIGEYIKRRRQELGLLQKDLCDGICEQVTLSRLENGRQYPSRSVMNALLQRLDLSAEHYIAVLSDQEIKIQNLRDDITALSIRYGHAVGSERSDLRKQFYQKKRALESLVDCETDKLNLQFLLRTRAYMGREDGAPYSEEEKVDMFLEAMRMTVPKFELDNIGGFVYTLEEVKIINSIGCAYARMNEKEKNLHILEQLFEYMQRHAMNVLDGRGHLPMVVYNYARALNLCGCNEKCLKLCEYGRQLCIRYGNHQHLPRLIHTMALAYHDLGHEEESRELFCEAYYLCKATGDDINMVNLKKDARDLWGMEFEH